MVLYINIFYSQMILRTLALTNLFIWANSLIMNKTKYSIQAIEKLLNENKLAVSEILKLVKTKP